MASSALPGLPGYGELGPTGITYLAMASSALPGLPGYGELGLRGVESAREPVGCGVARLAQGARLHDMTCGTERERPLHGNTRKH